ncbi:MAG: Rrf2 family transcriptional regulator [Acidimicrobiia bacterium]|nr:Rrf2 family transcriptional regulator [Acidimicrobiia bacterium]
MRITAKVDYAVRAAVELADGYLQHRERVPVKADVLAAAQEIPPRFLETILSELRRSGIVGSKRGSDGGYWLARPPTEVSVADIIRAVEGPLADVHGQSPEEVVYAGVARDLQPVWVATRVALRGVLEETTLADIASGALPERVVTLAAQPGGWTRR